jgi:serine/threonine protein kinase
MTKDSDDSWSEGTRGEGEKRRERAMTRSNRTIGNYQLGESLGKGTAGEVYKALNRATGDFVAIKQVGRKLMNGLVLWMWY